jgi:hypothetical protein
MPRWCSDSSRSYPGRAASRSGKCGKGLSVSASRADPGAAGRSGQSRLRPTPKAERENQTGRLRKRHDQRDEDSSGAGNGFAAAGQGPNLAGGSEGGEESAPRKGKTPDLTLNFLLGPSHETNNSRPDPDPHPAPLILQNPRGPRRRCNGLLYPFARVINCCMT